MVFAAFARETPRYPQPYQLWFFLNRDDAGQDAVYFHTPNPNAENFPAHPTGVAWGVPALEQFLNERLPGQVFQAGFDAQQAVYYAYSLSLGEPLA